MVGVVTDLLKSSLDEGLKQLVRPVGLVPATLFVLLHALLTYPRLVVGAQSAAVAISKLDELWQLVLLLVVILALGYLLQSATGWIGQLYTGDAFPAESWVTWRLQELQRTRLRRLSDQIKKLGHGAMEHKELELLRLRQFPWNDAEGLEASLENVMPTALGNVMLAPAWAVWNAYGIDPTATWVQLRAAATDSTVVKAVDEEKAAIDTLLNTSAILIAFAITAPALGLLIGSVALIPYGLVALIAAYGVYRVAIARSAAWADALRAAFDVHRPALAKALGLTDEAVDVDRATWEEASRDLAWDFGVRPAATSKVEITALSSGIIVSSLPVATERTRQEGVDARLVLRRRHSFTVSVPNDSKAAPPVAFVRASDTGWPVRVAPTGLAQTPVEPAEVILLDRAGDRPRVDDLVWQVTGLAAGASVLVDYLLTRTISATLVAPGDGSLCIGRPDADCPASFLMRVDTTTPAGVTDDDPILIRYVDDGQPAESLAVSWHGDGTTRTVTCEPTGDPHTWDLSITPGTAADGYLRIAEARR